MSKQLQKPFSALYPMPLVLVTCVDEQGAPNIVTLAYVGTAAAKPPQAAIAIRPSRYSHAVIGRTGEFVINIANEDLLPAVDQCGHVSGARTDKFARTGLTPEPASQIQAPLIAECPVNLECKLTQTIPLGSHDLFIGEIVAVHVDEESLDERGFIDYSKIKAVTYVGNEYWSLGKCLGASGFTLKKNSQT
jgi:flavin reductase (DIM6/NTAB) family NADH-FMN oxidoreductase RutF